MSDLLTAGNAAKLYCLEWIAAYAANRSEVSILDLGCGQARNFVSLLRQYPQVRYVGIEPSPSECEQARRNTGGLNATIINGYAYDVYGKLVHEPFDLIVSFSVFEHVYRRLAYLQAVKACLKPEGRVLINYDAGHFVGQRDLRERLKNLIAPFAARMGKERYFQAFVHEAEFQSLLGKVGLKVEEARRFNTHLKGLYKQVTPAEQPEFMRRWLEMELWLDAHAQPYDDSKARLWFTRNFILSHDS